MTHRPQANRQLQRGTTTTTGARRDTRVPVTERRKSTRSTYHHGDLARALVDETVRLVGEAGPEAVSLREVARRIGVNHAALYRHFADKESLLARVAEEGWSALADGMEAALANAPAEIAEKPAERLVHVAAAYARYGIAHPAYYTIMTGPRLNEQGRFPSLEVPIRRAFELLITEFERALRAGTLRGGSAQDWALRVWMFAHGYVTLVLGRRVAVKPARVEEYFERLLRPMLGLTP